MTIGKSTTTSARMRSCLVVLGLMVAATGGCASGPAAEVSKSELAAVRSAHAAIKVGDPRQQVLDSFKSGNKVKLGASELDGASIEEWKVEAFHDEKKRKDLFVTFLYFRNNRFVDGSDTRIDYRNNPELIERWKSAPQR